jgi:formate hydrogenlyase subunit 3/multisubunit Na+/H+ antiporter MnhD subunit
MSLIFFISVVLFIPAILLAGTGMKRTLALVAVLANSAISSLAAVRVLSGASFSETFYGGAIFGNIFIRADALSAWFVLLTNFTAITGILYGRQYLKHYPDNKPLMSLHFASYVINHAALTSIFFIQHSLAFLCSWEIMALSAFILVIYEHGKMETLKAGINYLIQSHISIILLTLGFLWVYTKTGSFDFRDISAYCLNSGNQASLLLFLVFFTGFGIKSGFVPFHTWLPYAHPAAPSHVSGIMSGVIIKSGIYGIMRMLLLMPDNKIALGYIILGVSLLSGVYGVMLAIVQHNLKRLLAYHSIENIGIIGIGIGIGTLGAGLHNDFMIFAGYAGALLHTLNHSLFKSLLFFTAGNIYLATHNLMIDRMGGLGRKMPRTAALFLIAALAICGLPPFNGFISEFLIYSGLFNAIRSNQSALVIAISVFSLALIGGLALLCFTKAFGIIFLGNQRHSFHEIKEDKATLFPNYLIAGVIILIGLFPQLFLSVLVNPVSLYGNAGSVLPDTEIMQIMQNVSLSSWGLILAIVLIFRLRKWIQKHRIVTTGPTWGCGYDTDSPKLQYTASSFVKPYVKIIKPVIDIQNSEKEITELVPNPVHSESHFHDRLEMKLIDQPTKALRGFLGRFKFLQNGRVQFYVLYGVVFIGISITIPLVIDALRTLVNIIKQL